jgi:RNA polymerase sigma factor (TIGR02999 family)
VVSGCSYFGHAARVEEQARPADQWFTLLYAELRTLAAGRLKRAPNGIVSPTTLVHELYVSFTDRRAIVFPDRARFMAYAARAMRGLIVDFARHRQALKRGSAFEITRLTDEMSAEVAGGLLANADELSRLSEAIDELAAVDSALAELVDLKYFCGFTLEEIAAMRGVSERTVRRDWEKARLVLYRQFGAGAK